MRNFLIFLLVFHFTAKVPGQELLIHEVGKSDTIKNFIGDKPIDEIVYTPFGPAKKSNVHYVSRDHHLSVKDNSIQIVRNENDQVIKEIASTKCTDIKVDRKLHSLTGEKHSDEGWITYAYCSPIFGFQSPISQFSATWNVPSPPNKKADQLIYLFIGLQGASVLSNEVSKVFIIQPVLQWGISPAGGGDYWAICNWMVVGTDLFFHDSLIKVTPGVNLEGVIKLTSDSGNLYSYRSYFEGYDSKLEMKNMPELQSPHIALEAYNLIGCDEYPSDEKLRVRRIKIITGDIFPEIIWFKYEDFGEPVNECGQFTEIIDGNSQNGEIDIHFHTPTTIDNFDIIHIYPNPANNYLHISPKSPIINCRIEVFNNSGEIIHNDFIKSFDYEKDIDFTDYSPGQYFIRFSFFKSIYSLKESIQTFKVIKK